MFGAVVLVTIIAVTPAFMLFFLLTLYTVSGPVRWTAWKIQGKKGFQEGIPARQTQATPMPSNIAAEQDPAVEATKPEENTQD
jgi:hypothetical protein